MIDKYPCEHARILEHFVEFILQHVKYDTPEYSHRHRGPSMVVCPLRKHIVAQQEPGASPVSGHKGGNDTH